MAIQLEDSEALQRLEARLKILLPEEYQECYDEVQPVSMGSAGLKYGSDGKVAWDEIWGSFCDLAMAGGPPHKGTLLEPGSQAAIDAHPDRYDAVVAEIRRGIHMVTDLPAEPSPTPGWVRVNCTDETMAGWLVRAIVMENVSARLEGSRMDLPAGPDYRVEKEIKNVITSIAKTCHYFVDHMWSGQRRDIAELLEEMATESPLLQPAVLDQGLGQDELRVHMAGRIEQATGLTRSQHSYVGWLGLECPSVRAAIWMMRALVTENILSRREETVLFIPVDPKSDPDGTTAVQGLVHVHRLAVARDVLK